MNKSINTLIHGSARFAVAVGTFIALASAVAIITVAPTGIEHAKPATEVVRLEPVVVTISKARYTAIRAEAQPSMFVRLFAKKPTAA